MVDNNKKAKKAKIRQAKKMLKKIYNLEAKGKMRTGKYQILNWEFEELMDELDIDEDYLF